MKQRVSFPSIRSPLEERGCIVRFSDRRNDSSSHRSDVNFDDFMQEVLQSAYVQESRHASLPVLSPIKASELNQFVPRPPPLTEVHILHFVSSWMTLLIPPTHTFSYLKQTVLKPCSGSAGHTACYGEFTDRWWPEPPSWRRQAKDGVESSTICAVPAPGWAENLAKLSPTTASSSDSYFARSLI